MTTSSKTSDESRDSSHRIIVRTTLGNAPCGWLDYHVLLRQLGVDEEVLRELDTFFHEEPWLNGSDKE